MRALWIGVVGLTAACGGGERMYYLASTEGAINGVAMRSAPGLEQDAQVGMNDLTCLLGIGTGNVNQEWNYGDTQQERVLDVGWQGGQEVVAIRSPDTLHFQTNPTASTAESSSVPLVGVRDARLLDEGFVALTETEAGCAITWSDGTIVPIECPEVIASGPGTDVAIVGRDTGLDIVTPEGNVEQVYWEPVGFAAWDGLAEAIYAAEKDGESLMVLDADGSVRYDLDLGYPIVGLDAAEGVGKVIVAVDVADGGGLFLIDGNTGEILGSQYTPVGADDVSASLDGTSFAVADDEAVHFYGVGDTWEATGAALETWNESRPRNPTD